MNLARIPMIVAIAAVALLAFAAHPAEAARPPAWLTPAQLEQSIEETGMKSRGYRTTVYRAMCIGRGVKKPGYRFHMFRCLFETEIGDFEALVATTKVGNRPRWDITKVIQWF